MEPTCAARAMEWSIQLEMGLRSTKRGVPVKAILEMEPRLRQWSREPESGVAPYAMFGLVPGEDRLFANAILLRLADAFRGGDMETRLSVVRVFLSEQKHRDKKKRKQGKGLLSEARVANHLELLKRVKSVFDSGDSKSRSLALVLFGCWADFLKDNAQIRYLIFSNLVSPHDCEVKASLYATGCFCEISDDFASISVEMLFNIMNSSAVSLPLKLAAARVLAKCKSSYSVAHKAYKIGMELVQNSSDEDFLVAMLFSLSKLACILIPFTSYQVDFLLSFLNQERTSHVQETVLRCLHFLFRRGLWEHPDNSGLICGLFSIMEEPEISLAMQYKALTVLHKVLLSISPSSLHMELREFVKLLTIIENASQYPASRKSYLAIRILADLCCRMKDRADVDNVFCCSSLPSRVISVIKDHIKVLVMSLLEGCQNDLTICQELQGPLKILLTIVERHPYLGSLVLDNIKAVIEYLVTVTSTDRAVPSTLVAVNFKGEKQNSFILKLLHKIYRFLVVCLENLYIAGAINTEVFSKVNILAELVCQCSLIDCYTYTLYHLLLHSQPICDGLVHENDETRLGSCLFRCTAFVNKVLTGTNGWTAYKVGVHAACQGEWLLATNIFSTLMGKVKSDSCSSWLKALFHYAHSEGKIQLLSQPKQGITSMELMETIKFPLTSCDYMDDTFPRLAGNIDDCNYYDQLTQSHVAVCSSLKILETSGTSSQPFCFQRWFLSLRARVLENLVSVFKALREVSLNADWNFNQVEIESSDKLQCLKSHQDFTQISLQLFRLAEEFDLLRASFIGMDSQSSAVLAAHGLCCSVLAFAVAFGVSNIDQHSNRIFIGDKTSCNLQAFMIQNLRRLFWCVDHGTKASLSSLLNYFDPNENCLSPRPNYRTWNIGYKDREVLNVCSYAVSSAVCLYDEKIASRFTKNALSLLSSTLIKWMHIDFRIPKYFFKLRPFIRSELFVHNEDSRNGVDISISQGSHLTLNICLQLKNVPPNLLVKSTKLYCILHCSMSFLIPCGQILGHSQFGCEAWKDDEIVELNQKLFCHVLDSVAGKRRIGMHSRGHGNSRAVETFMDFRPNEKGQGFSHCSLDVSNFPVGSYKIKWHSCLVDSQDSYWSLLPLNSGPVFVIKPRVDQSLPTINSNHAGFPHCYIPEGKSEAEGVIEP
ncbi:Integrator complex subunit 7 [Spatholobus suberectus]|nr:Integrator complex subunit 7 [Spatholobus suberectus]